MCRLCTYGVLVAVALVTAGCYGQDAHSLEGDLARQEADTAQQKESIKQDSQRPLPLLGLLSGSGEMSSVLSAVGQVGGQAMIAVVILVSLYWVKSIIEAPMDLKYRTDKASVDKALSSLECDCNTLIVCLRDQLPGFQDGFQKQKDLIDPLCREYEELEKKNGQISEKAVQQLEQCRAGRDFYVSANQQLSLAQGVLGV